MVNIYATFSLSQLFLSIKKLTLCIVFLAFYWCAFSQSGSIDHSFNPTDQGGGSGDGANAGVYAVVVQPDGKIIIAGHFSMYNNTSRRFVARLNVDGTLDTSFNPGTGTNYTIFAVALQPDGKIIIAGDFISYNGTTTNRIARLNADGSLDTSFNAGTAANGIIRSLAIQADGKILIGGQFTSYNGTARNRIARLNADGSLDTGFDPGTGSSGVIHAIALQSDGKILIAGYITNYNGTARGRIARVNTDGTLDVSFNPGTGFDSHVQTLAVQPDGKIVVGGGFTSYNGTGRFRLARLNADATLDNGFASVTTGSNVVVNTVALQSDGKILIGGDFSSYNGTPSYRIARLNADASLDASFNTGTGANGVVRAFALQQDGKIITGGDFKLYNGTVKSYIAKLNTDGTPDNSFNQGMGANAIVTMVALQPDGKVLIGGNFSSYNGIAKSRIARLNSDGSLDAGFNQGTGADDIIDAVLLQPDGKILVRGQFLVYNGSIGNGMLRLNTDGSIDASFSSGGAAAIHAFALLPDAKVLVAGGFVHYGSTPRNRIARLNANGTLDVSFDPLAGANNTIRSLALQPDGKILIGGDFTSYTGLARNRIARLNADGSLDTSFDPELGANGVVNTLSVQADGKIIISGNFTSYNGTPRNSIARLNTDGSLDISFDSGTGANAVIHAVTLQPDGKMLIAGDFTVYNGTVRNRIARLNPDGSLDTGFNPGAGAENTIRGMALQADGNILIGGSFTAYDGTGRNRIARINGACPPATGTHTITACGSYLWNGITYTASNNIDTHTIYNGATNGCDSIVTLNLTIMPIYSGGTASVSICEGETYTFGSQSLSTAGNYTETFQSMSGCDSTVTLTLAVKQPSTGTAAASICDGETYVFGSQNLTVSGNYTETFTNFVGCDSVVILILTVNPPVLNTVGASICEGETYTFGNQNLSTAGNYTETFTNFVGCDSTVTLMLTVNQPVISTAAASICEGETYTFGSQQLSLSGVYTETFANFIGCDSVVTLTLTINQPIINTTTASICEGEAYTFGSQNLTMAGNYAEIFTNFVGCDSIVTLTLVLDTVNNQVTLDEHTLTATEIQASYQWVDCDNNNSPITGATQQSFSPALSGNYAVIVSKNGCTKTSNCILVFGMGVDNADTWDKLNIYPNPASDYVTMDQIPVNAIIKIIDIQGKVLLTTNAHTSTLHLDMDTFVNGMYLIQIENQGSSIVKKLLVNK